ncbi:hypothetical protein [Marinobacter sp. Arc7-DN-1]|uniref:hypothetical protein n=1 Tax=Marinobacter sp. Arc7-DN-1 TaxID=2304594 RepID=UPI0013C37383|nr:hypothetical protein [Marinobacter sp. Arc7-DN-1]
MKSFKEQLAKLFERPVPKPMIKGRKPKKADDREVESKKLSEQLEKAEKKKANRQKRLAKRKQRKTKNKKRPNGKDLEFSAEAIERAYHPVSKLAKFRNSLASTGPAELAESGTQPKLKASKPYGQQPNNQCAHCGKPAMSGYDLCMRCLS